MCQEVPLGQLFTATQQTLAVKGQRENILEFAGHRVLFLTGDSAIAA